MSEDFNTLLSMADRTSRQKISKEGEHFNKTRNQMYLTDTHKTVYATVAPRTFYYLDGTFPKRLTYWAAN